MDVYDKHAVERVWQRVGLVTDCAVHNVEAALIQLIRQEWELAAFFQSSSRGCWGELAQQALERAAKLRAVHYMLTEETVSKSCVKPIRQRLSAQTLREKIQILQNMIRDYRQTGQHLPDYYTILAGCADQAETQRLRLLEWLTAFV